MRVRFVQRLDYWIGIPLCLVFTILRAAKNFLFGEPERTAPQNLLFIELSEMGSAILAHSAIARIQNRLPRAKLFFLVFEKNQESVRLLNIFPKDHILVIDDRTLLSFARTSLLALRRLRSIRIDTAIDLELFSRFTAVFSYLTGARRRIGFDNLTAEGLYRGRLLTDPVYYNPHQHMALNFLALTAPLLGEASTGTVKADLHAHLAPLPEYVPSPEELREMWRILKTGNPRVNPGDEILVVNPDPGETLPLRGWPLSHYITTIRKLVAENPALFVAIIGLESAIPYACAILAAIPHDRCIDLTTQTPKLRQVVTLFTVSDVILTTDGGPAHFASLTGIRSVTLFGPETPELYGPLGSERTNLSTRYACSPCLSAANHRRSSCRDNRCLQDLSPAVVQAAVQTHLNNARKTRRKRQAG